MWKYNYEASPSINGLQVCELAVNSLRIGGYILNSHYSDWDTFLLIRPRIFLLTYIKEHLSGLLVSLIPRRWWPSRTIKGPDHPEPSKVLAVLIIPPSWGSSWCLRWTCLWQLSPTWPLPGSQYSHWNHGSRFHCDISVIISNQLGQPPKNFSRISVDLYSIPW